MNWRRDAVDCYTLALAMLRQRLLLSGRCLPANEDEFNQLYVWRTGP